MQEKKWMSIKQVADLLGVTSQTIRNYVAGGKLKAIILPSGHRRFLEKDVEGFMQKMSTVERADA